MYYVYCYFNPSKPSSLHECGFEPFYVGKGKGQRKFDHLKLAKKHLSQKRNIKNLHNINTICELLSSGTEPLILVLFSSAVEQEAYDEECRLIKLWGRRDLKSGPLTNKTDGGEGTTNKIFTSEYRAKLSRATKIAHSKGLLDSNIAAFICSQTGKKWDEERKNKRKIYTAAHPLTLSVETRKKISDAHKIIRQTDEWKAKASAAQLGKKHTSEHITKSIVGNPKSQPCELDGITYVSLNQCAKAVSKPTTWVKRQPGFRIL